MSKPILSPEEIAALMAEVSDGEHGQALFASLPPIPQPKDVRPYRFGSPEEDDPDRYPMFVHLHERLLEMLHEQWNERFKREVVLELRKMEARRYHELISGDQRLVYFVFKDESGLRMMLTFDIPFIVAFVDAMLGGDGEAVGAAETLSAVEMRLSRHVAERMADTLSELWRPVHPIRFDVFKIDTNPQFLAVTGANETCLSVHIDIRLGEGSEHVFSLHYPMPFLDPVLEKLRATVSDDPREEDAQWTNALLQRISEVPGVLRFELARCTLDIGAFLSLKPGDVLPIAKRKDAPCTLWLDDIPMFQAQPGEKDGMLAAKLL